MNSRFEYITTLEYRLKAASNEIAAFKIYPDGKACSKSRKAER